MKTILAVFALFAVPAHGFEVLPSFGRQGTEVFLRGVPGCPGSTCASKGVRFNGVEASMLRHTNDGLFATVPSLPEGLVDVSVVSPDGSLLTREDVFRYTTKFDANDYARVLFPITYQGPGANGSTWTSENVVRNSGPVTIPTIPSIWINTQIVILATPGPIPPRETARMPNESGDGGALLLVPRDLMQFVSFASHIRDTSRSAENLGTEIPVVREGDTAGEVRIVRIPADERYRPRLRIYDIDGDEHPVAVQVIGSNGFRAFYDFVQMRRSFVCVTTPCEDVAFSTIDLQFDVRQVPAGDTLEVIVSAGASRRLWGFVSLTNNETQQVTTYSPQ